MNEEDIGNGVVVFPPVPPTVAEVVWRWVRVSVVTLVCFEIAWGLYYAFNSDEALRVALGQVMILIGIWAVTVTLVGIAVTLIRKGPWVRYVVNGRTLAVLRPGAPVRFVKKEACVAIHPWRGRLLCQPEQPSPLRLNATFAKYWPLLCKRWWPEVWEKEVSRYAVGGMLPVPLTIISSILVMGLFAPALSYAQEKGFAGIGATLVAFVLSEILPGAWLWAHWSRARSYRCSLVEEKPTEEQGTVTGPGGVSRFPQQAPTWRRILGPPIAGLLIGGMGLYFFADLVPNQLRRDGVEMDGLILSILGPLVASFLALLVLPLLGFVDSVVRRRAWVCYMINSRTLAICVPGRATTYVKRRDCMHGYPLRRLLVLRDGRKVSLGLFRGDTPMWASVCGRWWPGLCERDSYFGMSLISDAFFGGVMWMFMVMGVAVSMNVIGFDPDAEGAFALVVKGSGVAVTALTLLLRWRNRRHVVEFGEPGSESEVD